MNEDVARWDQARKSPISALVDGVTTPDHKGKITTPPIDHPLDNMKLGTKVDNFYHNVKSYNLLMHHVRQAVVYMNSPDRQEVRTNDIEWFLDRIREDLSAITFYGDGSILQKSPVDKGNNVDG